ncbi:DNA/RNA non-specific endonuclease [Candidatus Pseudoscillospira sp. SGI.172]|uniref:DNA/RNA non-specific endonuclease n=1 Tax=Candidatus Pseudoscillospira sp. SGI.172 TaxID=3420582 RepID=UPI003D0683AE
MNTATLAPVLLSLCLFLTGCQQSQAASFSLEDVPAFSGEPYVTLSDNIPLFPDDDKTPASFERYSQQDYYGRCGAAYANVGPETMPTEERGSIGQVKPSGWHTVKYDCVDGKYLYNRCHLIGYQLTAENANELNLITGTRYLNVDGMLPFENQVAGYVRETGNHVLYRVTPVYEGADLVARGVQMEAWSVEDQGEGVCFNIYAYNAQPGVEIDYATGESWLSGEAPASAAPAESSAPMGGNAPEEEATPAESTYVLNTSSKKFHLPTCSGVSGMSPANRQDYTGSREDLIQAGYAPCGQCKP